MSGFPLSLALTAGSAILQKAQSDKVTRRQESLNAQRTSYLSEKAKEGRDTIDRYLQTITPEQRAAENVTTKADLAKGFQQTVDQTKGFEVPQSFGGKISPRFATATQTATDLTSKRINDAISNLSALGTPTQTQLNNSFRFGRTMSDVNQANTAAANVGATYMDAMGNVIPDPGLGFASDALSGLAMLNASKPTVKTLPPGVNP